MTNTFLKVNYDLFSLGLKPIDTLILAKVIEFITNTGDCFMSNKAFADLFNVSESTIDKALKGLESEGFVTRETCNTQKGRERHILLHMDVVDAKSANSKMTVAEVRKPENNSCGNSKLTFSKQQNNTIKENIKEKNNNIKEKIVPEENGTQNNPIEVEKAWLVERYNELTQCANGLFYYQNKFYKEKIS